MTDTLELLPAIPGLIGENYRLTDVARVLRHDTATLKRLAARGEFPTPFQVTPRDLRIERAAFEEWGRGAWRTPEQLMARRQIARSALLPASARAGAPERRNGPASPRRRRGAR